MVFDDEHLALWERGKGSTNASLQNGAKVTVFLRKPPLRESGLLPKGGIARFYASRRSTSLAQHTRRSGDGWSSREKDRDPEKKGYAGASSGERAEDLDGQPLNLS